MRLWGLHIVDVGILVTFLIVILGVGIRVSRGVKSEGDFYVGGRSLGKLLQFFLNFGNSTDSTGAVSISREVYRQGAGGVWIGLQTLFITPFFWFTQPWYRRARVVTMADLFVDRFNSKGLALAYSLFNIGIALVTMGYGNVATYKATAAMMVKDPSVYTAEEKKSVDNYYEYDALRKQFTAGTLPKENLERYQALDSMAKRGQLASFISYIKPLPFYVVYSAVIAIYIILGGLKAAAITDAVQGLLIIVMSFMLIPIGLHYVGGFSGLHAKVPEVKFWLFGTPATSDYTWYSIFAIFFASFIQIIGLMHNMSSGGSATNEDTARFGMITGGFTKRFVIIMWMLCGLLAIAVLQGNISDPDNAWGQLSKELLGPGTMGLMLSGMVLGHMPSVGVAAVAVSGLATRNIYEPLVRGRSPQHYLRVGQWAVALVLIMAIVFSMFFDNLLQMVTFMITFNTYFGAVVFLIFFWRRLTPAAILVGLVVWVLLIGVLPWVLPASARRSSTLLLETPVRQNEVTVDVQQGHPIKRSVVVPPSAVFFENIARIDPLDVTSAREGRGRFNVETYVLHLIGVPVQNFTSAGLVTARWLFDGLFPFVMLVVFSFVTPKSDPLRAGRFYAKMKTPVAPTPELDREEVRISGERPDRFDHEKLLPGTSWEFTKWTRKDVYGFFGCWAIVGLILLLLWGILRVGS
jgi:Na+/proline symporter